MKIFKLRVRSIFRVCFRGRQQGHHHGAAFESELGSITASHFAQDAVSAERGHCPSGNFGSGYTGLRNMRASMLQDHCTVGGAEGFSRNPLIRVLDICVADDSGSEYAGKTQKLAEDSRNNANPLSRGLDRRDALYADIGS